MSTPKDQAGDMEDANYWGHKHTKESASDTHGQQYNITHGNMIRQ